MVEVRSGNRKIKISRSDKIYFPKSRITKGEFIDYYINIAGFILPQLKNRPISMLRMPEGINGEIFFQKDAGRYFPDWIKTEKISKKDGGTVDHVICNNKATLIYLANQGCVTPHVWLSKIDKLNYPDRLIFDLDPSGSNNFQNVKEAAQILKLFLEDELKLISFLMTTGSKGLHVVIPILRNNNFDAVRLFAQKAASILAEKYPDKLTTEVRKNKRKGRMFLDTARNAFAQTAVPPYSVRPIESAPVAVPIYWDELNDKNLTSQSYNIKNIFQRISRTEDPWKDLNKIKNNINSAIKLIS